MQALVTQAWMTQTRVAAACGTTSLTSYGETTKSGNITADQQLCRCNIRLALVCSFLCAAGPNAERTVKLNTYADKRLLKATIMQLFQAGLLTSADKLLALPTAGGNSAFCMLLPHSQNECKLRHVSAACMSISGTCCQAGKLAAGGQQSHARHMPHDSKDGSKLLHSQRNGCTVHYTRTS